MTSGIFQNHYLLKFRCQDRIYTPQEYENLTESPSKTEKLKVKHANHRDVAGFKKGDQPSFKKMFSLPKVMEKNIPKGQKSYFAVNNFYEFVFYKQRYRECHSQTLY